MITFSEYRDETVRLLEGGIGLLERNGWTTGPGTAGGPRCAGNAVLDVYLGLQKEGQTPVTARWQAFDAIREAVRQRAGEPDHEGNVIAWNDLRCRSLEDATGLLREAIKLIA